MPQIQHKLTPLLWSLGALLIGLVLSAIFWVQASRVAAQEIESELQRNADAITLSLKRHLADQALLLKGFEGLFNASNTVSRSDFHQYFQTLHDSTNARGLTTVAYHQMVLDKDLGRHIGELKKEGFADYRVFPEGKREVYGPELYIEPFVGDNIKVIGFDPLAIAPERSAIERARDTDDVTISAKLTLAQDSGTQVSGFVMYVPIYQRGALQGNVSTRRAHFVGWVDAPFRMHELMAKVLPDGLNHIDLEIFDGAQPLSDALMFDTDAILHSGRASSAQVSQQLSLGGRSWTLVFHALPGFGAAAIKQRPGLIASSGVLLSLLLGFCVFLVQRHQRRRLQQMAKQADELQYQAREALRAQNEQALQRSEAAARQAEAQAKDALKQLVHQKYVLDQHSIVSTADLQGRITYANDKFCEISGYSREELLGQDHSLLSSGVHPQGFFAAMYETLARGEVWQGEICNRAKNGSLYWVRTTLLSYVDEAGLPTQYISVRSDITRRKASELELQNYREHLEELVSGKTRALQLQQTLLNATINATTEGLIVMDTHDKIVLWNQRFVDLWQIPQARQHHPDATLGREHMLAQVADPDALHTATMRFYQNPQQTRPEKFLMRDGRVLQRSVQAQKIDHETVGWVWSYLDITEHERQQAAVRAADLAKSEFLANMSHEIRTPMNGVIGMVDVLQQTELTPNQRRMLDTVASSSQTLLHILNDILDYSKIEAGKLSVEHIATPLKDVTQSVVQLMQGAASAQGVRLRASVAPELPVAIYADPTRLRQVLLNLLGNAIKFTPSDTGRSACVTLALEPGVLPSGESAVRLRVCDNGIGMSAEVVAQLFKPFTQADASTARQFGGTGLGLSISQRLVTLMGGQLTVQSTPGVGSEFTVVLPLQEAPWETLGVAISEQRLQFGGHAPSFEEAAANGQLILLAEDNETNRDVFREQLRLLGYCADMAEDGHIALEKFQSGRYALLLTDCHMPQMDGFELTAAIRATEAPGQHLPIIAITANAMQGEAQRCLDAGMDDYLSKPLRLQELKPMLDKWLPLSALPQETGVPATVPVNLQNTPEIIVTGALSTSVSETFDTWNKNTLGTLVGDNPGLHQRLLTKFLLNAPEHVSRIEAATRAGDVSQAADVAHTFKSAARSVGALALGELCQQIETAGRAGDASSCSAQVVHLAPAFAQVQASIRAHLER